MGEQEERGQRANGEGHEHHPVNEGEGTGNAFDGHAASVALTRSPTSSQAVQGSARIER